MSSERRKGHIEPGSRTAPHESIPPACFPRQSTTSMCPRQRRTRVARLRTGGCGERAARSPWNYFGERVRKSGDARCARNLLMALAGDACLVIGGRAGTISEVCLAWLHHRPLLPLTGCGGWSERLEQNPPDERGNSRILAWASIDELEGKLRELGLVGGTD